MLLITQPESLATLMILGKKYQWTLKLTGERHSNQP